MEMAFTAFDRAGPGLRPERLRPAGGYCGLEGKPGETAIRRGDSLGLPRQRRKS